MSFATFHQRQGVTYVMNFLFVFFFFLERKKNIHSLTSSEPVVNLEAAFFYKGMQGFKERGKRKKRKEER